MAVEPRVVVVTGHRGGIGARIAERFRVDGDIVIGLDAVDGVDLSEPAVCDEQVARILSEHGAIDVLCNNAGVGAVGTVCDAVPDDWERVFAVNVFAVAHLCRAVLPSMRDRRRGAVVNTCSIAASVGLVERAVYSASKGAVRALTLAMAADEVRHGLRVNCVSPATVEGPWVHRLIDTSEDPAATRAALEARQPLGRMVRADEVAAVVHHLADPDSAVTGLDYRLDAGMTTVLGGGGR